MRKFTLNSFMQEKFIQLGSVISHVSCLGTISEHSFGPMGMDVSFITNWDQTIKLL